MQKSSQNNASLSNIQKCVTLLINLVFGALPSLCFTIWIEEGCDFAPFKLTQDWSFLKSISGSLPLTLLWNSSLFTIFAVQHTLLAQKSSQNIIKRVLPPQAVRTFYLAITGLCLTWVVVGWQSTGIVIWRLPVSKFWADTLSITIFAIFQTGVLFVLMRFDIFIFFGIRQIFQKANEMNRTEGANQLITSGLYSIVRHPMYLFTMGSYFVAPVMTLDRTFIVLLCLLYLNIGVPIEEKKLLKIFGKEYLKYCKDVPPIFPKIF